LRNVITRRVLKLIDDESKKDPEKYRKWYHDFGQFLKEGVAVDNENKDQIMKLLRFRINTNKQASISLEDYVNSMKDQQ
jgi:HSP90 family molecular chaperone